jgi:hypothetical protein
MGTTTELRTIDDTASLEAPTTFRPYAAGDGITVIPSFLPVHGLGVLAAHAFLLHGEQPVLVDTGSGGTSGAFRTALESVIEPAAIRWLWLTHTDPDHTGSLGWLLDAAPDLRVVTTYLATGKLSMSTPLPMDRLQWANPGDTVRVDADRVLVAVRPPSFDAPETVGCFDPATSTLFSADTFGAVLNAPAPSAADIPTGDLEAGLMLWSTIDAPWLGDVDRARFDERRAAIARLQARRVLSAHLPPAEGADALLDLLGRVPDAGPWVGPDQRALEAILQQSAG